MKIAICSPSYKRPVVETLTLYPSVRVYVDAAEANEYREKNPGADIVECPKGVQGNVCRVRNYILDNEFNAGADCVVTIDDDMQGIYRYNHVPAEHGEYGYQSKKLMEAELMAFCEHAAVLCDEWGYKMWGINCVLDPKAYRQFSPFNTTKYIGSPFHAFLPNPIRYDEALPLKEDYDITLQHLNKYRGALRFNAYHYLCKQSEQVGGCATYRNLHKEAEQFTALQKKWGTELIRRDTSSVKAFDYNPILKSPIPGV